MKARIITIIAITVYLCSCETKRNGGEEFEQTIDLDSAEEVDSPLVSTFCDGVSTIILEVDGNVPMATVDKIVHARGRLYISDRASSINGANVIAEFDMNGKFIRRYGNRGRGPGEYIGISGFTVDEMERRLYLFDGQTQRIITYDLDNGKYVTELRLDQKGGRSNAIASVGDMIYMDTRYFDYDESNHMLKSWNKTNPEIENRYLSYGEYLEGWTDTSLENNNRFIWRVRNEYCLFSNRFSNEIFKCSSQNIVNYLRVKSSHFIGSEERQAVSASQDRRTGEPPQSPGRILASMNRYYDIQSYFEEEKHIGFTVMSGSKRHQIVYNKNSGYTKISTGIMKNDRVIKSDYLDTFFLNILQADPEGIFYCAQPEDAARIRTAAREGMLVDGLDRLEELKQLEDFSNPVLFYMKFKDPMR